MFIFDKIL